MLLTLGSLGVNLLLIAFVVVCLFLMLVILIQKPKGGGLAGAFGGGGGSDQAVLGARVGDYLTWFTVICFVAFLGLAMSLTWAMKPDPNDPPPANSSVPTPDDQSADVTEGQGGDDDAVGQQQAGDTQASSPNTQSATPKSPGEQTKSNDADSTESTGSPDSTDSPGSPDSTGGPAADTTAPSN